MSFIGLNSLSNLASTSMLLASSGNNLLDPVMSPFGADLGSSDEFTIGNPMLRRGTFAWSIGGGGGGGSDRLSLPRGAFELPAGIITPGSVPDLKTLPSKIVPLISDMQQGRIFSQASYVRQGGKRVGDLPENVLVAYLPAPAQHVIAALEDVNSWADWHSYFSYSHAEPGSTPDSVIQRFRLQLPASSPVLKVIKKLGRIDSQVRVEMKQSGVNWQAVGSLYQANRIRLERGHIGLKRDDLAWTVYHLQGSGTILVYQILTHPDVFGAKLAAKGMTEETVKNANRDIVESVAARAVALAAGQTWSRGEALPYAGQFGPYRTIK